MFKEELKRLSSQIPGARGVLIMGLDGIAVDKYVSGKVNLEIFSAEYLSFVKKSLETNQELGLGAIREMTVFTEQITAIIKAVTPEYFLVFAIPPAANYGLARYELGKSALRLAKEFA